MKNKHKKLIYESKFVPILIFFISFFIFSFNLEGQGPHRDEPHYNAAGIIYFDLTKQADFLNPCWNGVDECKLMCLEECSGNLHWAARSGFITNFFIGFGHYLSGSEGENAYSWSAWLGSESGQRDVNLPDETFPTPNEFAAGRTFSPVFGSLTVVFAFLIGKLLFNRFVGVMFSSILLFHSLWLWNSRTTMSEVFYMFFIMLAILIFLYAILPKNKIQNKYLILSGIIFAIAINQKILAFEFFPFFLIAIFLRDFWFEKSGLSIQKKRNLILRPLGLCGIFLVSFVVSIFISDPFYYIGPIEQVNVIYESMKSFPNFFPDWFSYNPLVKPLGTFSVTVIPIIDVYFYNFAPNNIPEERIGEKTIVNNYSSIPLSLFFIIGAAYLLLNIKRKNFGYSEFLLLILYLVLFISSSIIVFAFNMERFLIPVFFATILVASYGCWKFLDELSNKKITIVFLIIFVVAHAFTTLNFWKIIYFEPTMIWKNPLPISFQESLANPFTISLGIIFLSMFFIIVSMKIKSRVNNNLAHN